MKKKKLRSILCIFLAALMLTAQFSGMEISAQEMEENPAEEVFFSEPQEEAENVFSSEESVAEPESSEESVTGPESPEESVTGPESPEESVTGPESPEESITEPESSEESVTEPESPEESVTESESPEENFWQQTELPNTDMAEAPVSGEKNVNAVLYVNGMAEDLDRVETETGKDVLLQTGVRLSGENSTLKNGTVEIRIPDSYIKNKLTISQAESFDGPPVIARTEGEYQITCKLKELPVGSSVIAPLHFITKPYSMPNLSETVITLHVKENDETVATKQLTIVNRSVCKLEVYDREVETFDEYRPDNPTHTPSDLTKCPKITSKLNFHDEYREFGLYSPKKVKVVVQLAPETYFDSEEPGNRGWMYDEKNKTLVRFFEYRQESRIWGQEVDIIYQLPNVEYKKKFQAFTYYAAALDESGNELSETKSETGIGWSTIRQKDPPTPRLYAYCETRCRNPQSNSYYYTPDNKDKISEWDISTFNHSDWRDAPEGFQQESPLIYVKDIHSIQWDEDMFLYSMTISSENLSVPKEDVEKLNHNTLWAYSRNGGWFIAGRNLQLDQKFQIPERDQDGNEICINGGIRLEFDEKIPLPHKARERKGLIIKYETKVKAEE